MLKVNYVSDIHTEFYRNNTNPLEKFIINGDVLVIAGDLSVGEEVIPVLNNLADKNPDKYIVFVPGNHEFYSNKTAPVENLVQKLKEKFCFNDKVFVLYRDVISIEEVNFIGCVGWIDGSGGLLTHEHWQYADIHQIHGFIKEYKEWGKADFNFIFDTLKLLKNQRNVVVTHFLPATELICERFKGDYLNPCFANNWIKHILDSGIKNWIYGHSHANIETKIGNCRFYSNQAGYKHEINKDYVKCKYFEI